MDLFGDYGTRDPNVALADGVRECPHLRVPETHSVYVLRAGEVAALLADDAFTSERPADPRLAGLPPEELAIQRRVKAFLGRWPVFSGGEYHEQVRRALVKGLHGIGAPPDLPRLAERLIVQSGPCDWLHEVCHPMATALVGTLVGEDEAERVLALGRIVLHELATPLLAHDRARAALDAVDGLRDWLGAAIEVPRNPLLAALRMLWHEVDEQSATAVLTQVVTGAYDPVVSTLGTLAERLSTTAWRTLPNPVIREEVLRLATPFRFTSRYARRDVLVGPYRLDAGQRVNLGLATANLDSFVFDTPLECRRRDGSPRTFTFGGGRHYCPGASLARAAVDAVLDRMVRGGLRFVPEVVEREPELAMLRYRTIRGHVDSYGD